MSVEPRVTASPQYAIGQLEAALRTATSHGDEQARRRAEAKAAKWRAVLSGMSSGALTVGSRTPVADTPAWVTLEVVHGGFATGRYVAEAPPRDDETARLDSLPGDTPGATDRERLNLWYLSDNGRAELLAALDDGSYRIDVPEDGALMVVAWLLANDHAEPALDLVAELRPWMHRLRMTPRLRATPAPSGGVVRLEPVGTVAERLREARTRPQVAAMLETLRVWHPLYDRLVALWCETVEGELPHLSDADGEPGQRVSGGWPCRVWPPDWTRRRGEWLADYEAARRAHGLSRGHEHPRSNFCRLRRALEACEVDSRGLTGREVGWVRRALANTISRHGAPGSEPRAALRAVQAAVAARPTHAALAKVLAARLDRFPQDGGIPSIDPLAAEVAPDEAPGVPAGSAIPQHLVAKLRRALEAPVEDLVACGVIRSGDVLARVLPQITSQLLAADFDDPRLVALYAQTYAAFRRRRSLLLLNLEHQVRFEELPWVGVLDPFRTGRRDVPHAALDTLRQTVLLALSAFPHAILPNPLVREMGALATQAGLAVPLVEEVAADIFMGTFTEKWRRAAAIASRTLAGSLYARYYDLPPADTWAEPPRRRRRRLTLRWGKETAEDFAAACRERAREAQGSTYGGSWVADNGTVIEQSQILTTHNLAVLVDALQLRDSLGRLAPELADRVFRWVVGRHRIRVGDWRAELQMIKNTAYAWRQAIFFLALCDEDVQRDSVARLRQLVENAGLHERLGPAVEGLAHVVAGGRFDRWGRVPDHTGRRLLGWSVGRHWCLGEPDA